MKSPKQIVNSMYENDSFSKNLGITIVEVKEGSCILELKVTPLLLNGFGILHGGVAFSLSDTCLAFSANSFGNKALSTDTSISHFEKVLCDEILTVVPELIKKGRNTAVYSIRVFNQKNNLISLFKGSVYFLDELW
jgi:acyl-CoA thioesterase